MIPIGFLAGPRGPVGPSAPTEWGPLARGLSSGVNDNVRNIVYLGNQTWVASVYGVGGERITTDDGATWGATTASFGTPGSPSTAYSRSMSSDGEGFGVVGLHTGYLGYTEDYGSSWSSASPRGLNSGSTNTHFYATCISGDTVVAAGSFGRAAISFDRCVTWLSAPRWLNSGNSSTTTNGDINYVCASGDYFLAVLNAGYAAYSIDGGVTWLSAPRGLGTPLSTEPLIFCAVKSDGEFLAINLGGQVAVSAPFDLTSWTHIGLDSDYPSGGVVAHDGGGNLVRSLGSGVARLSTNYGSSWQTLPANLNSGGSSEVPRSIAASGSGKWMAGFSNGYAAISPPLSP